MYCTIVSLIEDKKKTGLYKVALSLHNTATNLEIVIQRYLGVKSKQINKMNSKFLNQLNWFHSQN
jgi:hypothetical protein